MHDLFYIVILYKGGKQDFQSVVAWWWRHYDLTVIEFQPKKMEGGAPPPCLPFAYAPVLYVKVCFDGAKENCRVEKTGNEVGDDDKSEPLL